MSNLKFSGRSATPDELRLVALAPIRIQHTDGTWSGYYPTDETDASYGTRLAAAVNDAVSGDVIFLAKRTYAMASNAYTLVAGVEIVAPGASFTGGVTSGDSVQDRRDGFTSIVAAGDSLATATAANSAVVAVTGADDAKGVRTSATIRRQTIINLDTVSNLLVYPPTDALHINALSNGTAYTLGPGLSCDFLRYV